MIDRWIVDNEPSRRYPIYTRGNVGEVFPEPVTPLTCTSGIQRSAEPGWRDALERFGAFRQDEFSPDEIEIIGVFGGYCYLNVSVSRVFGVRTPGLSPEQIDFQLFGEQPGVPPYEPHPGDDAPDRTAAVQETLQWILGATALDELQREEQLLDKLRANRPDLTTLTPAQLAGRFRELLDAHLRRVFSQHLFTTYCSMVPLGIIQQVCTQLERPDLLMRLIAGVGDVESAAPSMAMWSLGRTAAASPSVRDAFDEGGAVHARLHELAAGGDEDASGFLADFDAFVRRFGARGPNEWETRSPTWETEPDLALAAIDRMRLADDASDPVRHQSALAADRERLSEEVLAMVEGDAETHAQLGAALRAATVFLPGRERSKTNAVKLVHEVRVAMHELGRRMVEAGHFDEQGDYGMLRYDELDDFVADPGAFAGELRRRAADYRSLYDVVPPFLFVGTPPPVSSWARRADHPADPPVGRGDVLVGIPGCPGTATGRARVVLSPFDAGTLEPGEVLVAPLTDPSWTPLFVPAAAVVVDVGAPLSHAIIVSRELGIPCAVSVTAATTRIRDGALVEVDGTSGTVTVLDG